MKSFRRYALLVTIAAYLLIFTGGLVRVSGAGLGCPDWPKCFGRWLPPTSVNQLPPDIDPSLFNFTLAWIEYFNRFLGMVVGILVLILALRALKNFRKYPGIIYPAVGAAFLVAMEGWQGGILIALQLEPLAVTLHLFLAILIVSLLIFLTQRAYSIDNDTMESRPANPRNARLAIGVLWFLTLVQILFGTQIRSAVEIAGNQYPLLSKLEWLANAGAFKHLHMTLGVLLLLITIYALYSVSLKSGSPSSLSVFGVWAMGIFILMQVILGVLLLFMGLPPVVQVFHMWLSSLYIGAVILTYSSLKRIEAKL